MFKVAATENQDVDVDEYAATASGYIQKCTEDVWTKRCISGNEKPWMTTEVRALLRSQDATFIWRQ